MKTKILRWSIVAIVACIAIILIAGLIDWLTKYQIYLGQRNVLYEAIKSGSDYESIKKTVSYLQGAATRSLNNLKSSSLYFAVVLAAAAFLWHRTKGE